MAVVSFNLHFEYGKNLSVTSPEVPNALTLVDDTSPNEQWQIHRFEATDFYRIQNVATGNLIQVQGDSEVNTVLQAAPINTGFATISEEWFFRPWNSPLAGLGALQILNWLLQKVVAYGDSVGDGKTVNMLSDGDFTEDVHKCSFWRFAPFYDPPNTLLPPQLLASAAPSSSGPSGTQYKVKVSNLSTEYTAPFRCAIVGSVPTDSVQPNFMTLDPTFVNDYAEFSYFAAADMKVPAGTPVAFLLEDANQTVLAVGYSRVAV